MIQVTQTYIPDAQKYTDLLKGIWQRGQLTNNGVLVQELEKRLKDYLNLSNFYFCNNGTIVLQMAIKALGITKEIITTPFSYVATTGAILWENCTPVFVDINPQDFNIDVRKIESKITENTEAILATHVFGNPCNVYEIEKLAKKYNLKVIYDAAHAFGVKYNGASLFDFGDVSTCSFHATKIFHSGEGGAIICNDETINRKIYLMRQFGHIGDEYFSIGINGKASELHAAMGLCVLEDMKFIINKRKMATEHYNQKLDFKNLKIPIALEGTSYNYAYYPVVFENEATLIKTMAELNKEGIYPRRYFYPSLNKLPYLKSKQHCPVSEDISRRILCLPLSTYLLENEINQIANLISKTI